MRRRRSRGQAVVELALLLPVFLMMTVGVVDMARMFSALVALRDGVREAAIYAGQGTSNLNWCTAPAAGTVPCPTAYPDGTAADASTHQTPDPDNIAYQLRSTSLDPTVITLYAPVCAPDPCATGSTVTVKASYTFVPWTPILPEFLNMTNIPLNVTISASVR